MENRVRVLLVEDDVVDQMAFKRLIDHEQLSYDVVFAETVSEARAVLSEQEFDIALVDYLIGNQTAFDLIEDIEDVPIIIITGRGDEEIAVKAMKAGALDYLVKDAQGNYLKTLPVVVENTIARRRAENELAQYREHLEELVEERTAELARTNQQLVQEINERKQVERALREYTERLNILRELDRTILETQFSEGVARAALHHVRKLVACQSASVVLLDLDTREFYLWVIDAEDASVAQEGQRFSLAPFGEDAEHIVEMFLQDKMILIEDSMPFYRVLMARGLVAEDVRAALNMPLMFQQELVGVLALTATGPDAFGETQIETARDVGNQLAIAIRQSRLHEQIQRHAAELEKRVAERTAALQTANDRLRVLSRMKDDFVSNVSHELRTPITNMKLYHDLLDRRPDKRDHYTAILRREINRLESLIEALLMLSRLEQDREQFSFVRTDLNMLLKQFVADRKALAATKGISLVLEANTETAIVEADQRLLEQVLSILLTNALAYTPAGGCVTVRTLNRVSNNRQWVGFSVSDTGPGISDDEQVHLFDRFFRGKAGRDSNIPGTGLGLSIAKEIIERHEGSIEVHSEGKESQGAVFSVWLASR
ncbi:MAG: response regulator [Anaerolineae bacterium]|nr:response regulator [Anaerolineae bacterium]